MKKILHFFLKFKFTVQSLLGFSYLLLTLKIFNYVKIQNKIILLLKKKLDSNKNLIIFSGGESSKYLDFDNLENTVFFLNSYNSLLNLNNEQRKIILDRTVLYYQAPYHKPLIYEEHVANIENICNQVKPNTICIYNKLLKKTYKKLGDNNFEFRSVSTLFSFNFLKFSNVTGALFLINIASLVQIKKIKVLGFDANWFYSEISDVNKFNKSKKNFLDLFLWNYEILYQIKIVKNKLKKYNSEIDIHSNSWFNINL